MQVLDALKFKIHSLTRDGQPNPLIQARLRYGTEEDIDTLFEKMRDLKPEPRQYFLIDLTPFERIGNLSGFLARLANLEKPKPVLMVIGDGMTSQIRLDPNSPGIMVARFSEDATFIEVDATAGHNGIHDVVAADFNRFGSLQEFRADVADRSLTELLGGQDCLVFPRKGDENARYIGGQWYREMPNGMLVSSYLNLKEVGKSCEALTSLAYEIVLVLSQYFRRDREELKEYEAIVAPNNTALFLAAAAQAIMEIPVICVDRLGPIPSLHMGGNRITSFLKGKKVALIEEVVATANELDRALFFLSNVGAEVRKIVALYNLEIGKSMLVKQEQMTSLCRPKRELRYVYRSQ